MDSFVFFIQCRDIPELIEHTIKYCYSPGKVVFPIDYGIATWWTPYHFKRGEEWTDRKNKKIMRTLRYNLFNHIGKSSNIDNEKDHIYGNCYGGLKHWFNFYIEKFDIENCAHSMLSPCEENSQNEFKLIDSSIMQSHTFLKKNHVCYILDVLGVVV